MSRLIAAPSLFSAMLLEPTIIVRNAFLMDLLQSGDALFTHLLHGGNALLSDGILHKACSLSLNSLKYRKALFVKLDRRFRQLLVYLIDTHLPLPYGDHRRHVPTRQ